MIGGCAVAAVAGNMFAVDESISWFSPYASLKAGCAFLGKRDDIKYKCGAAGAVELGMSYDAWKFGFEMSYKSNKIKDFKPQGNFEGTNYILNGKFTTNATHAAMDVNGAGGAVPIANYIRTDNPSVFALTSSGDAAGLPGAGIAEADWDTVKGGGVAADDQGLVLRNASYLKFEKMNTLTGMLNVCYDYAMTDAWSIYGGLGLGVARVNYTVTEGTNSGAKLLHVRNGVGTEHTEAEAKALVLQALPGFLDGKLHKTEYSKTAFAWQLMAGVGYEFNENWKLTLGYKLFNTAKVKQTFAGKEYNIKMPFNHTAELGLTYTF